MSGLGRLLREAGRAAACLRRIDDCVERALHLGAGEQRMPLIDAEARVAGLLGSEAPLDTLELALARLAQPLQAHQEPATTVRRLRDATLAARRGTASFGAQSRATRQGGGRHGSAAGDTLGGSGASTSAEATPAPSDGQSAASAYLPARSVTAWAEQLRRASTSPAAELRDARQWAERLPRGVAELAELRTGRVATQVGYGVGMPDGAALASMATSPTAPHESPSAERLWAGVAANGDPTPAAVLGGDSASRGALADSARAVTLEGAAGLAALNADSPRAAGLGATAGAFGVTGLRKLAALATEALDDVDAPSVTRGQWLHPTAEGDPAWDTPTQPLRSEEPAERAAGADAQPLASADKRLAYAATSRREAPNSHYVEPSLDLLLEQRLSRLLRAEALAHGIDPDGAIR